MFRQRWWKGCLLVAGLCSSILVGCDRVDQKSIGAVDAALSSSSGLRFGQAAVASLPAARRALYDSLAAASSVTPEIVYDTKTKAVLSVALSWKELAGSPTETAHKFVDKFQQLLDPRVDKSEYVPGAAEVACDGEVVLLDRALAGKAVIGSRLTLHFDDRGHLVWVTNGVASVPATITPVDVSKLAGALPLEKLMGNAPVKSAKRIPVLVPMADFSGLYEAELATWYDAGRTRGAVAVGYTATSRLLDAQTQGQGRTGGSLPKTLAGVGTDVPSLQSYRNLGGMRVNFLDGERNPLESAYRFLEEHPTLLHTGVARCQYTPARFDEVPTVPGVFTVRFDQRHGRLPVFGAQVVVRLEGADTVQSVTARARGSIDVPTTPSITAGDAVDAMKRVLTDGAATTPAVADLVADALAEVPATQLVVMPGFLSRDFQIKDDRLAWRVDRGAFTVLVDALTQKILWGATSHAGSDIVRDARGSNEFGVILGFPTAEVNGLAVAGAPSPPNGDVSPGLPGGDVSASMASYESMLARQSWQGLSGHGGDLIANTNVAISGGGCPNAFFDFTFTNQAFFCLGEASIDVVGHEFTHGVIAHSSGLLYADQSGAINEAYADLFGNLNDRASTGWLIGEQTLGGTIRDMMNPGVFGQPAHFSGYVPRAASCGPFPGGCDSGGVHTNSGIINRAHALLADGLPGMVAGIGRDKLERLAFFVMTQQLPSSATMNQVAGATREVCDMFVARGVTTVPVGGGPGVPFTNFDCDSVTNAFHQVGLDPAMGSSWSEPSLGFFGTDTIHASALDGRPDLTPGLCPVSNIQLEHSIPLLGTSLFADYDPTTPLPPSTAVLDWVATTGFNFAGLASTAAGPLPLGTPVMLHRVNWTSAYGIKPSYHTDVMYPTTCTPPPVELRMSAQLSEGWDTGEPWGSAVRPLGNPSPTSLNPGCILRDTKLQLLGGDGSLLDAPGEDVHHTVTHWILFVPATFTARARVVTSPTLGGTNLAGAVRLDWDLGRTVNVRWQYEFTPTLPTIDCNPL